MKLERLYAADQMKMKTEM